MILPGFRFHPTDEELVSFYLKRKVQQRPLSIELIRQLDIYKYDPWDLPSKLSLQLRNICACVCVCVCVVVVGLPKWFFCLATEKSWPRRGRRNGTSTARGTGSTGTARGLIGLQEQGFGRPPAPTGLSTPRKDPSALASRSLSCSTRAEPQRASRQTG